MSITLSPDCPMTPEELADLVREAQSYILDAISALRSYVSFTGDHLTERTVLANLEILTSRDHNWLGRSRNLDDVLDDIAAITAERQSNEE